MTMMNYQGVIIIRVNIISDTFYKILLITLTTKVTITLKKTCECR